MTQNLVCLLAEVKCLAIREKCEWLLCDAKKTSKESLTMRQ